MNSNRECGCKGHRSCARCEKEFGIQSNWASNIDSLQTIIYSEENKAELRKLYNFWGIEILENFVTQEEEDKLVQSLDDLPWDKSQSGRRKQNYGPKANFKKRKTKAGPFCGFPETTKFIQDRFETIPMLQSYKTVEQCSIEYTPETGACIEPHIDDCWIWGERIVQLNLLRPTYLTFTPYHGKQDKYNLFCVESYPRTISDGEVVFDPFKAVSNDSPYTVGSCNLTEVAIKVPLPPRSLLIVHGSARYDWEHCIVRSDIEGRRIVIAYREFTPPYLPGGREHSVGGDILSLAQQFWSHEEYFAAKTTPAVIKSDDNDAEISAQQKS